MKQFILVLLMAALCPFMLAAQTTNTHPPKVPKGKGRKTIRKLDPIIIDFTDTTKMEYQSIVPHNSSIDIIIENVNLKVVDTSQSVQRQTFNETPPKLFETFSKTTIPDASAASAAWKSVDTKLFSDTLQERTSSLPLRSQVAELERRYQKLNKALNDRLDNITAYRNVIYKFKFLLQYQNDLLQMQNECNKTLETIIKQVNSLTHSYFYDPKMGTNGDDRGLINDTSDYNKNRPIITKHIAYLVNTEQETYDILMALFATGAMNKLEKDIKTFTQDVQKTIANLNRPANKDERRFLAELSINEQVSDLESSLEDLKYFYQVADITKLHTDFSKFPVEGKNELLATYDFFDRGRFVQVVHVPLIKEDEIEVAIAITPKAGAPCQVVPRQYNLSFRPKGKLKIDFSSGLFVNLGGHDFKDQSYRYEDLADNSDSSVIRKNKGKNAIFPSVGALMHVYWRNGRDFHPAFTFGVSTKDLDRINYHLGGSLIFGYSQRFILSAGGTLTRATLIDDKYMDGQKVAKPEAGATVPTASFNRLGFFIAFTYNVSAN